MKFRESSSYSNITHNIFNYLLQPTIKYSLENHVTKLLYTSLQLPQQSASLLARNDWFDLRDSSRLSITHQVLLRSNVRQTPLCRWCENI